MTGAHLFSYRVEHSWSNSVLHSSSWTVSWTVLGTLTHFSSGTWWHCSSKSWWHSFLVFWACWQSFLYWRLHCLLDGPLGDLALALLDIGAGGVGHLLALLPGHRLVLGPGHLLAHLLGHLPALGLGGAHHGWRVELQGEVGEDQDQGGGEESLHGEEWIAD